MKVIFSIAKNEFRYLFYSPIAWFVLLVFMVQCGYFYSTPVYSIANSQDIYLKNLPSFSGFGHSLTFGIFLKTEFFPNIIGNLYLFIPMLTMGLISRESTSGTNALLYSSPVSIRRIVLGKYIGIMLYNLLLVLVIALFLFTAMFNIKAVDYGSLLSALLGFYLLVCSCSAIGMFMSSLSSYQIVSALGTLAVIFLLSIIGTLWQRHDFVRDLTWFLSLQDRTAKMLKGLIVTKDLIYFILVSGMFIAFTYFRMSGKLEFRPWYIRAGRYLTTIVVVLLVGYISSRPPLTGYLDTTATQSNTLSLKTQEVLHEFGDSTLEVTLYTNLLSDSKSRAKGLPENRNADYLANLWEPYLRFKPDIKFKYVYYYANDPTKDDSLYHKQFPTKTLKDIANDYCTMIDVNADMFLAEDQIQPAVNLRSEDYHTVMQLKYQGRTAFLRTFLDDDFWPNQYHTIAAFKRVLGAPIPFIAFSSGSLERDIYKIGEREYAQNTTQIKSRTSLVNIGFDMDSINLHAQPIPDSITALVIADPKMNLSTAMQEKITHYINKGGNLIINGEPGKQYVLNPLLSQLGVQLANGQLVYPTYDETPDKVFSYLTENTHDMSELTASLKGKEPLDTFKLMMPGTTYVTCIDNSAWKTDSLATTIPNKSWLKGGSLVIDSTLPPFSPLEGDIKRSTFPTIQRLTRKINGKEQRIVITGDADFANNSRFGSNSYFLNPTLYSWMADNRFPIMPHGIPPKDVLLTIGERVAYAQKIVFIWILPALLLIAGTIFLIRRKRK